MLMEMSEMDVTEVQQTQLEVNGKSVGNVSSRGSMHLDNHRPHLLGGKRHKNRKYKSKGDPKSLEDRLLLVHVYKLYLLTNYIGHQQRL